MFRPTLRDRHNITNGQLKNAKKKIAVAIDSECTYVKAGFANTRLKENSGYIEDQSTDGQDMSTAATMAYGTVWNSKWKKQNQLLFTNTNMRINAKNTKRVIK